MSVIEKLRASRKEKRARLDALSAKLDTNELSAEEQTEFDALVAEIESIDANIRRCEAVKIIRDRDGESPGRRTTPSGVRHVRDRELDDPMCGYNTYAQFARDVHAASRPGGAASERLRKSQELIANRRKVDGIEAAPSEFHTESAGGEGGYEVVPQMREEIWQLFTEGSDLINQFTPEPTSSNAVDLLADESTPWGATGVQAKWRSEASQMTATKSAIEPRSVRLHELYAFVLATGELLEDAPRLQNRLTTLAARAMRWKASDALVYGTGAGQPLGWFNSGALVTITKESGQGADTFNADNAAKMFARMLRQGADASRAFWMMNPDVLPQLITMTISNQPIWTPPQSGMKMAPGGTLLGAPILLSDHGKTLGDKGDVTLVVPDGYYLVQKVGGMDFQSSIHLYFDYNIEAFRWLFRIGGQPLLSAPVTPANGSSTRSHFVTIEART